MTANNRLYYLDNLKVFLIFLVIIHHVGQAYGVTGGAWLYSYPGERVESLLLLFGFNAAFFMGLFFFISGYFFPVSFDRHGARKFITEKLIRFGIPVIFAGFLMVPVMEYVKYLHYTGYISFSDFYVRLWLGAAPNPSVRFNFAHLWFVEHLLVYAVLYAALRTALQKWAPSRSTSPARDVRLYMVILYMAALAFVTHLMRTRWGFPIDRWIFFLGFIQMEPAHIPQYLSLFILGILAYRYSFLESITRPKNMLWLIPGLGIFIITAIQFFHAGRQSTAYLRDYREALLCVSVCIGLLALFRTYFNHTSPIKKTLAENAFGAYIVHVPIVVTLQYAFDPIKASAFTLFVIVSVLSITASFCAAFLLRRIPGLNRVL